MFLKNPKLLFKSNSFKLITLYTILFIAYSLIINIYSYTAISSFIYDQSRDEIIEEIEELGEMYKEEGFDAVYEDIFEDEYESMLFHIKDTNSKTVLLRVPEDWEDFREEQLNQIFQGEWNYLENNEGDEEFELTSLELQDGSILQLAQTIEPRENLLENIRKVYLFAIIPVLLFAYLGGVFIADRALNPMRQLINTLNSIVSSGKVDLRAEVQQTDKLYGELSELFNTMLDKIENLIRGMKSVLDNVAHDLRTPMTRLRGTAEIALQSENNVQDFKDALADCIEESERILITLNTLMDVSEAETGSLKLNPVRIDAAGLIDEILDLYFYVAEEKNVKLNKHYTNQLYINADRNWIRQVIANLLDNAIKYTPTGGKVDISTDRKNDKIVITVKDTGVGIPSDELENIWERLYRGDKSRTQRGLGLGLSLVKAIVGAHKGYVEVTSKPGMGSIFSIYLPN